MFEPNRFETHTGHDLLDELGLVEIEIEGPLSVIPEDVHHLMEQPCPWQITEGPWPYSNKPENWAS